MQILKEISTFLQQGDDEKVFELTEQALAEKVSPREIMQDGLIAGMNVIGGQFKNHEIFLPDVLLAAKAMTAGMDLLKPHLIKKGIPTMGKVVIGTVHGDLHDIGKNLVGIMLKGAGFDVVDLGKDVPAETFVQTARREEAEVVGMSALLTTTMPVMKKVVELLKEEGLSESVKTVVGGAPISNEYAREIGADAYAFDAANAVDCVKELMRGLR